MFSRDTGLHVKWLKNKLVPDLITKAKFEAKIIKNKVLIDDQETICEKHCIIDSY